MQRHICSLQIARFCGAHAALSEEHLSALYTALSLHYEHGYNTFGQGLLPTDMGPSDPYALLAGRHSFLQLRLLFSVSLFAFSQHHVRPSLEAAEIGTAG